MTAKAAVLAFALFAAVPAAAAPTNCLSAAEHRASLVRQLQTELMVAALSCARHPSASLTGRYNAFVHKFGKDLSSNAEVLRGYFSRAYGKAQARQFDAYITALANEASRRSMVQPQLCESISPLFDSVLKIENRELESFAAANVEPSGRVAACASH